MPLLLLFHTLLVGSESGKEILTLAHFLVSIGVDNLSKILHQPEVGSHNICQACKLTEFWDQSDLIASLSVFVDEEWLVWVRDGFVVPSLVVLGVADLSAILVKCALWTHAEVDAFDPVGLLVVSIRENKIRKFANALNTYLVTTVQPTRAVLMASYQSPPRCSALSRRVET